MGDGGPGGREPVTILSATDRSEVATDRRGSVMLVAGLFIVGVVAMTVLGRGSTPDALPASTTSPPTSATAVEPTTTTRPARTTTTIEVLDSPLVWEEVQLGTEFDGWPTVVDNGVLYLGSGASIVAYDGANVNTITWDTPGTLQDFDVEADTIAVILGDAKYADPSDPCPERTDQQTLVLTSHDGGDSWDNVDLPFELPDVSSGRLTDTSSIGVASGDGTVALAYNSFPVRVDVLCVLSDLGYDPYTSEFGWGGSTVTIEDSGGPITLDVDDLGLSPTEREVWDDTRGATTYVAAVPELWLLDRDWTPILDIDPNEAFLEVAFADGRYVAAFSPETHKIWTSPDGLSWTEVETPADQVWASVSADGTLYLQRWNGDRIFVQLRDGSWEEIRSPLPGHQMTSPATTNSHLFVSLFPNTGEGPGLIAHRDPNGQWFLTAPDNTTGLATPLGMINGRIHAIANDAETHLPRLIAADLPTPQDEGGG